MPTGLQDIEKLQTVLMAFLILMGRFSGFFAISPFFSRRAMPRAVRLGIIAVPSIMCTPALVEALQATSGLSVQYAALVSKELMLGFFLGVLTWLPVRGLELAGTLFDTQIGSTQGQDLDVIFSAQTTSTAILLSQIFSGYFFSSAGFIIVMSMLFDSISIWPPTDMLPQLSANALPLFLRFSGMLFFTAVALTLPISGFLLLADIAIAFLTRTAQSLNALTFAPPVKSFIVLTMLGVYLEIAYPKIMEALATSITLMSKVLAP
ncbi:type III secretory pathway component EscT [Bradyrhizobium sp. USDA 4524]|uniref:EscT/YscT/HrcT family type III secretion system export apparatus protein n=1 Tax=unclassified Bradyrhizobium TaxID=2631580 RepID=UPI0020A1BF08|nr:MULTISPECIES: flagellar biosynthetic protein FliR [unclassified Bradyrhizobium]MCP1846086.1 type III secretory pathway component EscT [Bradyrhizobium sp. USDA 4538]MCP1907280.1 type III secretory pathway component EscT [Bradyrhizobium sp. USDA 4537]MCP1985755.1 type III secretory pathway component EscT [Bradyrhizobium sp. USDA 4539]